MKALILLFCTCYASCFFAQNINEDFSGTYKGTMLIYNKTQTTDSVDVVFYIRLQDDSSWQQRMIFNSEKYGEIIKDYLLIRDSRGNYRIDEQNGIVMPLSYFGNTFYSNYILQEHLYTYSLSTTDFGLHFEISVTDLRINSESVLEESEEFVVKAHVPHIIQKVDLYPIKR